MENVLGDSNTALSSYNATNNVQSYAMFLVTADGHTVPVFMAKAVMIQSLHRETLRLYSQ